MGDRKELELLEKMVDNETRLIRISERQLKVIEDLTVIIIQLTKPKPTAHLDVIFK